MSENDIRRMKRLLRDARQELETVCDSLPHFSLIRKDALEVANRIDVFMKKQLSAKRKHP